MSRELLDQRIANLESEQLAIAYSIQQLKALRDATLKDAKTKGAQA